MFFGGLALRSTGAEEVEVVEDLAVIIVVAVGAVVVVALVIVLVDVVVVVALAVVVVEVVVVVELIIVEVKSVVVVLETSEVVEVAVGLEVLLVVGGAGSTPASALAARILFFLSFVYCLLASRCAVKLQNTTIGQWHAEVTTIIKTTIPTTTTFTTITKVITMTNINTTTNTTSTITITTATTTFTRLRQAVETQFIDCGMPRPRWQRGVLGV